MGEIKFVGTDETRGYPYPACKKEFSSTAKIELTLSLLSSASMNAHMNFQI